MYVMLNRSTNEKAPLFVEKMSEISARLVTLGLNDDPKVIEIIKKNMQCHLKLIPLFVALKKYNILLTDSLCAVIDKNPSSAFLMAELLEFMHEQQIDFDLISIDDLLNAADSASSLKYGIGRLSPHSRKDKTVLNLMVTHPEDASAIADMFVELEQRCSIEPIALKFSQPSARNLTVIANLLKHLSERNDFFYDDLVDILLRNVADTSAIADGAKKLVRRKDLLSNYFYLIDKYPQNSTIIAESMLLLPPDCQYQAVVDAVGQFNVSVLIFLKQLHQAKMLDAHAYQIVARHCLNFQSEKMVHALRNIKLFEVLPSTALAPLLTIIDTSNDVSEIETAFTNAVDTYHADCNRRIAKGPK